MDGQCSGSFQSPAWHRYRCRQNQSRGVFYAAHTLRAHGSRGRLIHRSGQCLEINISLNASQRITQMIDLPFTQLRRKEVVFDRRALLHLDCSDKLERPPILPDHPR